MYLHGNIMYDIRTNYLHSVINFVINTKRFNGSFIVA